MAIKNNDDVTHLLSATGRTGTPYREFDSTTDQMSAPLIDAIFGKDPPPSEREEIPLAVGATSGNDLLADVFDRSPGISEARPADRGAWRDEAFQHAAGVGQHAAGVGQHAAGVGQHAAGVGQHAAGVGQHAAGVGRSAVPAARGPQRTLADIRRIISQPVGQAVQPPSPGGLNGLFDRLAR